MPIFRRGRGPHALLIAMSGIKLGERFLHVGSGRPAMFAALAGKVGLTGRAAAIADDDAAARALSRAAAREGVLVDIAVPAAGLLPHGPESFDLAMLDGTDGAFATMGPAERSRRLTEIARVIRPGGRALVVETAPTGIRRLLGPARADAAYRSSGGAKPALEAAGFRPVRVLAERDGFRFTEGLKPGAR